MYVMWKSPLVFYGIILVSYKTLFGRGSISKASYKNQFVLKGIINNVYLVIEWNLSYEVCLIREWSLLVWLSKYIINFYLFFSSIFENMSW
jgi:hypothetical protein